MEIVKLFCNLVLVSNDLDKDLKINFYIKGFEKIKRNC